MAGGWIDPAAGVGVQLPSYGNRTRTVNLEGWVLRAVFAVVSVELDVVPLDYFSAVPMAFQSKGVPPDSGPDLSLPRRPLRKAGC
jgi:hypothetical protein